MTVWMFVGWLAIRREPHNLSTNCCTDCLLAAGMKRSPISRRSRKMRRAYVERRKLVAEMLAGAMCARCGTQKATEVHELLSRARGGSILDPDNCVPLCHTCHSWITTNPKQATLDGWLRNSWEK